MKNTPSPMTGKRWFQVSSAAIDNVIRNSYLPVNYLFNHIGEPMNSEPTFSKRVKFPAGTIIIQEGEKGGPFYILLEGKCEVLKRDFPLTTLAKRGIIFGEMSMLLDIPRTATVQAIVDVTAYEADISLDDMLTHYPKTTKSIMRTLAKRVVHQTDVLYGYIVDEELAEHGEIVEEE